MRVAGVALLLGLAAAARGGPFEKAEKAIRKVAREVRPAVVTVTTPHRKDFDLTGVVIAPGGVVLTVRSPLLGKGGSPPGAVPVRFPGKRATITAELIDDDAETDTALYRASGARARPISVARAEDVSHGMWVLLVGNAFGQGRESTPTLSLGVVSGVARDRVGVRVFHSSAMVNPGSFGAPVVDLSGDLIGITAPTVTPDGQQTVVVPYDRIRRAYREKGGKGAKVVGRPPPTRRFRNHIVDLLGPVLQDAARRAGGALVAVRALPLPGEAEKKPAEPTKPREQKEKKEKEKDPGKPQAPKKPPAPPPPRRVPGARPAHDRSSGLIVDPKGLVLAPLRITGWPKATRKLEVDLLDGRTFEAKVLGQDERLRVVLLKIEARDLPVLEPAPAEALRAGHFAVALGYPHARPKNTPQLTFGILSRTEALAMVHPAFRALQTDAAVSAANRGGPLVDVDGRLLGVLIDVNDADIAGYMTRARGRYAGNAGVGFAVPWTVLETLVPRLEKGLVMKAGLLGVRTVESPKGLEVVAVVEKNSKGQPTGAQAAGIEKGDRILSVGGTEVRNGRDLRRVLGGYAAGDKIALVLRRADRRLEVEAVLGEP
ncbi:MAG: trypsin-like peptidase domain-containing protein [Planctomycetota bacterium]